jgi:hypothetical protein
MTLQYTLILIINLIPYYLGIGFTISAFYSLIIFSTRDEEAELNVGEIILAIFLYPFIIYQIFKNYKNGK